MDSYTFKEPETLTRIMRGNDIEVEGSHRKSRITEIKRNGFSRRPNKRVQRGRQKRLLTLARGPSIFEKEVWEGSAL